MTTYNKIIQLGCHCNITYLLQHLNLKKETTLFEWFQSDSLAGINDVLTKIDWFDIDPNIVYGVDNYVNLGKDLGSNHYKINDFKPIFVRRAQRFYDTIQNNNVLFIRLNVSIFNTTLEEIIQFRNILESIVLDDKKINKMKFMLISTIHKIEDFVPIQHDWVIHKYILKNTVEDPIMINDKSIQHILKGFLDEAGFDTNDTKQILWNDHS
jgi:hypothetical protein